MWNPLQRRSPVEKAKRGGKLTAEEWRAISFIDGYWPDSSEPSNQYGHVSVSRALSLVPVFGAARLIGDTISSLTPVLYTRDKRGIPQRQPTPSLFNNPSVHGTLPDWLHRGVVSQALQGDAIGLITRRDFYGFPTMVEWLNPEQVATQDGKLEGPGSFINPVWWWWGRPLNPQNLLHIPWFTMPWRVRGLSPIGAYQLTTNVGIGAEEYAANWYANGGVPPGTFQNTERTFEEKDADQITSRLVARLQARKPLVYGKDWTYNPIAIKPNEALFVETMRLTATQIAVIYGLPPEKIGGSTGSNLTYTTTEMNTLDYLMFSIRPWLVKWEYALSNCFPRGYYVRFQTSEMLRLDAETQAKVDQMSLGSNTTPGWRQVDEVRADHDWGPMPKAPAVPTVVPLPSRPADGDPNNITKNPDDSNATNGLGGWTEEPDVTAVDKTDVVKPDIKNGVKRSANGLFGPVARAQLLAKPNWRDRMTNGSDPVATKGN